MRWFPAILSLALAACSGATHESDPLRNESGELIAAENRAHAATKVSVDPRDAAATAPGHFEARRVETNHLPPSFYGRWGMNPADCDPARSDAKGLMEVGPNSLRFYESHATLGRVIQRDPSRIIADFNFVGEGQVWTRRMLLDGQDRGRTLVRREYGEDATPGALRYRRCDAT